MSERDAFKAEMRNALGAEKVRAEMRLVARGWHRPAPAQPAQGGGVVPQWLREVCRYISDTLADGTLSTGGRKVARTIMHMLPLDGVLATPAPAAPDEPGAGVVEALELARDVVLAAYGGYTVGNPELSEADRKERDRCDAALKAIDAALAVQTREER